MQQVPCLGDLGVGSGVVISSGLVSVEESDSVSVPCGGDNPEGGADG